MAALNKDTITGFHFAKGGESPWAFKISIFIRALQDVCGMIRASLWLPWFRYVLLPLGETLVVSAKEFIGVYRLLFREVLLVKALSKKYEMNMKFPPSQEKQLINRT